MELSYRFIPEPKGLVSSIDFNSFEGNQTKDSTNGKDTYVIHGKAKQTELGKVASGFKVSKVALSSLPTAGVLEYNQAFSWSMWVKPTSNLSGALLGKMDEKANIAGMMYGWKVVAPVCTSFMHIRKCDKSGLKNSTATECVESLMCDL